MSGKIEIKDNKISVLISVYGYEKYISGTITSILNQTFNDFEFIIVDDGCKYDLKNIVDSFNDKRIVYLKNYKNSGLTKSLITGLNYCKGKYIARMDAGNIALPERLEKQYSFLEKNPDYYLVGSSVRLIDENSEEICIKMAITDFETIKKTLPMYNCFYHSSIMFRNEGYSYREKFIYSQDYDFYFLLLSNEKKLTNLSDVLLEERYLDTSITFNKRILQDKFQKLAKKFYFERAKFGKDSYHEIDFENISLENSLNNLLNTDLFFKKQKAYYLLFGNKREKLIKISKDILKQKIDIKIILYLIVSYFPFLVALIRKIKKIYIY